MNFFYITPDLFNEGSLTSMAAFLKEYFCGVPGLCFLWFYVQELLRAGSENAQFRNHLLDLSYLYIFFIIFQINNK